MRSVGNPEEDCNIHVVLSEWLSYFLSEIKEEVDGNKASRDFFPPQSAP
jgi:hypothetical protein